MTLFLSFIIISVLAGYGYLDSLSRRNILIRKMEAETRTTGRILKVLLENFYLPEKKTDIQHLIDDMVEREGTLGILLYYQKENTLFRSHSLSSDIGSYYTSIQKSIRENRPQKEFGIYNKFPVFSYAFPFKNQKGGIEGAIAILRNTSLLEYEVNRVKWNIFIIILILTTGMVILVLFGTRKWVALPISNLIDGVKRLAGGDLDHRIELIKRGELSELAQAFNQMAVDLKKTRQSLIQEADARLELERNLRRSEKLATIGQLASGLAHEIGTPLNIISGRTELIKRRLENQDEIQKNLDIILGQIKRITGIIQQLLGLVRGKRKERSSVQLNPLLDSILELLEQQIQKQGVRILKNFQVDLPPVKGDSDQLQQVFINLILNAVQAMPNGGTLRLSTFSKIVTREGLRDIKEPYVEIEVQDNGSGMEHSVLQNLFHPFFTTKETGTGLGLMVSQGIVKDHDGWMEVESKIGKGSIFKVFLPASAREVKSEG